MLMKELCFIAEVQLSMLFCSVPAPHAMAPKEDTFSFNPSHSITDEQASADVWSLAGFYWPVTPQ